MGRPMCLRLLAAGYRLNVWNRSPDKLAPVLERGASSVASPAEVARAADIVMLCVTDQRAAEEVLFGRNGVVEGGAPGKLVVDFSSIAPAAARAFAVRLEKTGMGLIDAPVSGGTAGAENGTLAIMAGGRIDQVERARPVLMHLARQLTRMGDSGAGQVTKLCNQVIVGSLLPVIAEAVRLAEAAGVDASALPAALKGGFADSVSVADFRRPHGGAQLSAAADHQLDHAEGPGERRSAGAGVRPAVADGKQGRRALPAACGARQGADGSGGADRPYAVKFRGMARGRLVAGNWKMHGSRASIQALLDALLQGIPRTGKAAVRGMRAVSVFGLVAERLRGSPIAWGAQNVSEHAQGAYTGEVSAAMLVEFGCRYVIVGHSERRQLYGETDAQAAAKFAAVKAAGMTPILCVGETLAGARRGQTEEVVARQLGAVRVSRTRFWPMSPSGRSAPGAMRRPEQAQAVHAFLRKRVAADTSILYGGSVKPQNAAAIFAMPDVDGGLIGGASLVAKDFLDIVKAAKT